MSGTLAVGYGDSTLPVPAEPFRLDLLDGPIEAAPPARIGIDVSFDHPLGVPPLAELFRGSRRVLIVVSDATRATAAAKFLPALIERIEAAAPGVAIRLIVASGIHRRATDTDISRIVGEHVDGRYEVLRHDPDASQELVDLGRTRSGTVVRVNRAVRDHDRIVLTGAVGFHYYAGFSGGRKAVVPGLAARETIVGNHLRALRQDGTRHPLAKAGCLAGNPVHLDMAEGAALVGPHLLVNSILDDRGEIDRLYVGHWRRAHEAACRHVRAARRLRVEPRDLVVASAGGEPGDVNLIQSHKTFESAIGALNPGGVMVLVARCREGAGHAEFLPWFEYPTADELVAALQARFQVYGQTALSWVRKAETCRLILVSGIAPELARSLRATPARDVVEALQLAKQWLAPGTRGYLLPHGSRFLIDRQERVGSGDRGKRVA